VNNINIALCLSGLSKNYNRGVATLSNIRKWIEQYNLNVDVFIHTWDDTLAQEYVNFYKPIDYKIDHIDELDNVIEGMIDYFSSTDVEDYEKCNELSKMVVGV